MGQYFLGLDNGSTVCKAALCNLHGNELAIASRPLETLYPQPGWAERQLDQQWHKAVQAIREVIIKAAIDPREILGIGCTGHGNGLFLLDKQGSPLGNGIASLDSRATDLVETYQSQGKYTAIHSLALQSGWSAQTAMLLAWMKHYQPEIYEKIGTVFLCKDYVNYQLTGSIRSEYTDMSGAGLLDVPNRCYSKPLLDLYGIPEMFEALPPLAESQEIIGEISSSVAEKTGLAVGTPVIAGLFDVDSSAIGSGAIKDSQACIITGTWSINQVVTQTPIVNPNVFMTTIFAAPGLWLTVDASAASATNLEWFVTQFCAEERIEAEHRGISVYEVCSEAVAQIPIEENTIIFHPFLYGSNAQARAKAGFYGLAGWHTRAHLLRALYEGVAFGHLDHVEKLRQAGAQFEIARLTGGGSRSSTWAQMFSDILEVPIEVPIGSEIGAKGIAITVGVGLGIFSSFEEGTKQMVSVERLHSPNSEHTSIYHKRYQEYRRLLEAMDAPWKHLAQL